MMMSQSMPFPVVYHSGYSPEFPANHRFPMAKFRLLYDYLLTHQIVDLSQILQPAPCAIDLITRVHCPKYIDDFITGNLSQPAMRRLGLPWSAGLVQRTLLEVGGTLLAARQALNFGMSLNLAGGTHHAHHDFASGFCVINDIAVTAAALIHDQSVERILVVDCDVHQGDGTARLLADYPSVFTLSLHGDRNFPARKAQSSFDITLPSGVEDKEYLTVLSTSLPSITARLQPDLVIYDAGVDVHAHDALGHLALTDEGIFQRDKFVLSHCIENDIPVVGLLGGGYHSNPQVVAERHTLLFKAANQARRIK